MPKGQFEIWQKACGLTYAKCCLLLDKQLRWSHILQPAKQYCHDWMHCLVSAGIIQVAIYMICSNLPTGTGWSMVHDYLELWICPQHLPQHLKTLFDSKHVKKYQQNKKFGCQASEALTIVPILVHLVKTLLLPKGFLDPKLCEAFLACANLLDLVHLGQVWGICTPKALLDAAEQCLAKWIDAGLESLMIKKFHWTLHLASALQRFKKLPACFAMERKHRFICKFASRVCNTLVYEQTLLQECLAEELFHLKQPGLFTEGIHLVNGHKASKEFHALMEKTFGHKIPVEFLEVSARCKLEKAMCTKADIALAKPFSAVEVVAFVAYCGNVFAFAKSFQLDMDDEVHGSTVWLDAGEHSLVPATDLLCPLVHTRSKNKVRTLIPWQVRLHLKKQCQ